MKEYRSENKSGQGPKAAGKYATPNPRPATHQASEQGVAKDGAAGFEQRLEQSEAVREDLVARAKALIASQEYPSGATLGGVAGLLAKELQKQSETR